MDPMQPPDPVCRFCEDWCSGTCEGAREAMKRRSEPQVIEPVFCDEEHPEFMARCSQLHGHSGPHSGAGQFWSATNHPE